MLVTAMEPALVVSGSLLMRAAADAVFTGQSDR